MCPDAYRSGTQPPEVIASLCDAIRIELEQRDLKKYVNSILTAYVVRRPPDHEAGLGVLLRLKGASRLLSSLLPVRPNEANSRAILNGAGDDDRRGSEPDGGSGEIYYISGRCEYVV